MEIKRSGSHASIRGPAEWFTGNVRIDPLFPEADPSSDGCSGRLRHRRFYRLAELNAAIGELLRQLNDERPIRRLGVTRR